MEKILTIVIPTYNRKPKLLRLLKSIESQNCTEDYRIVISDNCSNYSVEEFVNEEFSGDFRNVITVVRRDINAFGDYNITSSFLHAHTTLLWIIGDDDEVLPGSIKKVIEYYHKYPEIPFFKYIMKGAFEFPEDIRMKNVDDLKQCHKKGYLLGGIFFISNNIYNIDIIKPYLSDGLYYSYCKMGQIVPMMHCLIDSEHDVLLCKEPIVRAFPADEDRWNYVRILTALGTFLDINWGDNYKEVKKFFKIISSYFGLGQFLIDNIKMTDKAYRKYVYWKCMNTVFKGPKGILELFALSCYWLERVTHIKFLTGFYVSILNKQKEVQNKFRERAKTDARAAKWFSFLKKHVTLMR